MAHEFVIKNGFISKGDSIVNGTISGETLNLTTIPSNDNSQTQVLVRNNTTGVVEYRDASTFSGASDTNTFVTGFTYNDNNTLTISRNDGVVLNTSINTVSALTVTNYIDYTTGTKPSAISGRTYFDRDENALSYFPETLANDVTINIGQESVIWVHNNTGVQINNGEVCHISSDLPSVNGVPSVVLAIATGSTTTGSRYLVSGVATHNIPNGTEGFITSFGLVRDLNITGVTEGTEIFLSETTPGAFRYTAPDTEFRRSVVGYVVTTGATTGKILVEISNEVGFSELSESLLSVLTENNASTGTRNGGEITINGGDNTLFDISSGSGIIVDNYTDANNPTITNVVWDNITGVTVTNLTADTGSYIFLNSSLNTVQFGLSNPPTEADFRDNIFLGIVGHSNFTNLINVFNTPIQIVSPINQHQDLTSAIGPFSIVGNRILNIPGTLELEKTAGRSFFYGGNFHTDNKVPSNITTSDLSGSTLIYATGANVLGPSGTTIDPNNYDPDGGGTITAIPGANAYVAHRIWHQPSSNLLIFQYGQDFYTNAAEARDEFEFENFVVPAGLNETSYLVAVIIAQDGDTDLDSANIIPQGKFAGTGGGGGSAADTLQTAYDNSSTPEIVTDATRGAVDFRVGSGSDSDNVVTFQQNSGTINAFVEGTGDAKFTNLTGTSVTSNSAINVFNGHINIRDNSYFLQGRTVADVNVSLIGVDSQDRVFVGNATYDTYIDSDTIVDGVLSAQTAFLTSTPTLNNSATDILVRNSSTGEVEYRPVSGITPDTNTFITGFTYNDANTFTISRNDGVDLNTSINTVTGLTVNGVFSASTYTGLTLNDLDDVTSNIPSTPDNTYQGRLLYFDATDNKWLTGEEYVSAGNVTIWAKKGSAGTIDKGCPVYITGFDNDIHEVELANASTGSTMPVIGFTAEDFDNSGIYPLITFGKLSGIDTTSGTTVVNPFGETWEVNDVLYMAKTDGGLTKFRPAGSDTKIQRIAKVLNVSTTNGQIFIFNTARTAGLPNLTTGYLWLGNGDDLPQEVIRTDVGITTTGFTYNDNNTFTITDDNGGSLSSTINQMSGLTVNGTLSATTLDATTILSGGTNLTTIIETLDTYVTGGTVSVPATDNSNDGTIGLFYKNSDGIPRTLPFKDTFVTGTTFGSNQSTLTRNDGTDVLKLTGGTNVTLSNPSPSTNQIKLDVTIPINTQNVLWVDSIFGDDGTALPNRQDKSYLTIGAALTDAITTGTTVVVRPGTYPEEGLVVNGNVSLVSEGGWQVTTIGPTPSSATSDILELKQNAYIEGFSINVPEGSFNGIFASNTGGTNSAYNVTFYGNGTTGSTGVAMFKSGGGKLIGTGIRVEGGGMNTCLKVDSGVLALEGIHVPQSSGSIENVLLVTTSGGTLAGRAQMLSFNSGNNNVTNVVKTTGGVTGVIPTALIFTPNIFNAENAYAGDGEFETLNMLGGRFENVTYAVKLDLAGSAQETVYRINSNHQPLYLYNNSASALSEFSLTFTQPSTSVFDSSFNVFGAEQMSVGFAERGTSVSLGRGAPYTTGMVVYTTDSTASSTSDGGNLTDVTIEAISKTGSTFTFQGAGANHTILVGVQRQDLNGDPLKFYGLETFVNSQASSGGTYVFESWNGSQWVQTMGMATNVVEGYSYGTDYFIRPNTDEFIRLGLNEFIESPLADFEVSAVTWSNKTINSIDAYWLRLRIDSTVTTLPNFERFKILDSIYSFSKNGVPSSKGLAQFRKTINLNGNIWSGTDGMGNALSNFNRTVGSGGNSYTHYFEDSNIDGTGKSINIQFPLPIGTCTAFPIKFKLVMEVNGAAGIIDSDICVLTTSALPEKVAGTLIADSSGGTIPIKRTISQTPTITSVNPYQNTVTILPEGYTPGVTTWADIGSKVFELEMGEINVQTIYEGDIVMLKFECTTIDANAEIVIYSLIVEGVSHQDGKGI